MRSLLEVASRRLAYAWLQVEDLLGGPQVGGPIGRPAGAPHVGGGLGGARALLKDIMN